MMFYLQFMDLNDNTTFPAAQTMQKYIRSPTKTH